MELACIRKFTELYKKDPSAVSFCPYRVCPIGAHSDHHGFRFKDKIQLNGTQKDAHNQHEQNAPHGFVWIIMPHQNPP